MLRHAARDGIVASARRAAYARVPPCAPNASFGAFASTSWSAATSSVTSACSLAASAARRAASSAGSTSAVTSVSPFFPSLRPRRMSTAPGGSGAPIPTPDPSASAQTPRRRPGAPPRVDASWRETARARGSAERRRPLPPRPHRRHGGRHAPPSLSIDVLPGDGFRGHHPQEKRGGEAAHAIRLFRQRACATAKNREVTVSFNADVAKACARFIPTQEIRYGFDPGRRPSSVSTAARVHYGGGAEWPASRATTEQGRTSTRCSVFVSEEQRLRAGEEVDMPVFFYLDPEFASDPAMADVSRHHLSYTFFRSTIST